MKTAFDLVGLLIVLMGPHVVSESAGEGVESNPLEAVAECGVSEDSERLFQGEHGFDYRAEFGALRGISPRKMFVARKHAVGQAMVFVERKQLPGKGATTFIGFGDEGPQRGSFNGHPVVNAVRRE